MMTPNQKRQLKNNAWSAAAAAPRKSYLGKLKRLNEVQAGWIKSLLSVWGECVGGSTAGHLTGGGGSFWGCIIHEDWNDDQAQKITRVLNELRKAGYKGEELIAMAKTIIWPKESLADMIANAKEADDATFVESVILKAFKKDNPVYILGLDYYTTTKTVTDMGRYMRHYHAPHLTRIQSEDRVRWCIELFNYAAFVAIRAAICAENAEKSEKILENG